jgi:hypothetical protein
LDHWYPAGDSNDNNIEAEISAEKSESPESPKDK